MKAKNFFRALRGLIGTTRLYALPSAAYKSPLYIVPAQFYIPGYATEYKDQEFLGISKRIRDSPPSVHGSETSGPQQKDQRFPSLSTRIRNFWASAKGSEIPEPQYKDQEFLGLSKRIRDSRASVHGSEIPKSQCKDRKFLRLSKMTRDSRASAEPQHWNQLFT